MIPRQPIAKSDLVSIAKRIARSLTVDGLPDGLSVLKSRKAVQTQTDGWYVEVGTVKQTEVSFEVWLDRYSGHEQRILSACFTSRKPRGIDALLKHVPHDLKPVRTFTDADFDRRTGYQAMIRPLNSSEFLVPFVERYRGEGYFFFSMYDPTEGSIQTVKDRFCKRAVAFFAAVAESQKPPPRSKQDNWDDYEAEENRSKVIAHRRRERNAYLAAGRKNLDEYKCQVCGFRFTDLYGDLGRRFAEAHHLDALGTLRKRVINRIDDLVTVCANCHRMLHKMPGRREDVAKLRKIVQSNRKKH